MTRLLAAASAALLAFASPVSAQDTYPVVPAEWVEVGTIAIADGHWLDYANHLATQWRRAQDFAKAQGWITDYEILENVHPRDGEPDLYLVTRFTQFETPQQAEERGRLYRAHMQQTIAQMQSGSGDRAEYRTVKGAMLLRKLTFRD